MAAVLERPHALGVQAARPAEHIIERAPPSLDGPLGDQPARRRVDGADGVRLLVGVRSDHDHLHRPFVGID
jgi:hypothetical protein